MPIIATLGKASNLSCLRSNMHYTLQSRHSELVALVHAVAHRSLYMTHTDRSRLSLHCQALPIFAGQQRECKGARGCGFDEKVVLLGASGIAIRQIGS